MFSFIILYLNYTNIIIKKKFMINLSDRERDLIDEICKKHSTKIKP